MSSFSNIGPISEVKAEGQIKMGNNYNKQKVKQVNKYHRLKNHFIEGMIG